jgi:eukaryotic-like serine/threonine-protein kinase
LQKGRLTGKTVGGYHLLKLLGAGAVGSVYHGYHQEQNLHAAVKILSPLYIDIHPNAVERFMLEARTVASLQHPHIIQIYDYGADNEHYFIAMQLLLGGTLEERLRFYLSQSKLPSLGEVAELLQQLASALTYAHSRNIIHRDVKSSNVMFDALGSAYLVDFGIVKLLDGSLSLTGSDVVIGTPAYMSPEQWLGQEITPATDQYALGSLIYLLLTGVLPFNSISIPTSMYHQVNEAPEPIHVKRKEIPEAVSNVVQWALAKDPLDRYPTVKTFAETFSNAVQGIDQESPGFFTFSLDNESTAFLQNPTPSETFSSQTTSFQLSAPPAAHPVTDTRQLQDHTSESQTHPKARILLPLALGLAAGIVLLGLFVVATLFGVWSILEPEPTAVSLFSITETPVQSALPTITALSEPSPSPILLPTNDVATGSQITVSNAPQVEEIAVITTKNTSVRSAAFHPAGLLVAAAGNSNDIQIWEVGSGTLAMTLSGHQDVIYSLAYSSDGRLLASGSGDGSVRLWDAETGQQRYLLMGHSGEVRQVAFNPSGTLLISVGEDQTVRAWETQSGTQAHILQGSGNRILCAAFSPDGSQLAVGWSTSEITIWDAVNFEQQDTLSGHVQEVRSLAFNSQSKLLASISADNTIRVWNIQTGMTEVIITMDSGLSFDVAFSQDDTLLASGGNDNLISLWDAKSGERLAQLRGHVGWVFDVQFTPDGSLLASASGDGQVRVWGIDALLP